MVSARAPESIAELPINLWCWGLFAWLFRAAESKERTEMIAVIAIAVPLELFFSEVWHIYEYQRGLMPLFVPPCHYFLFDLGRRIASRFKSNISMALLIPLVPFAGYGLWSGNDTVSTVMLLVVIVSVKRGPQPNLYAVMAWGALVMELWGTYLGNWEWADRVPWIGLTSWNPPIMVGSFYCFGDLLVNFAVARFSKGSDLQVDE